MKLKTRAADVPGVSASVLTLRAELTAGSMREIGQATLGVRDVRIMEGRDAIWVIVRREGCGGVAFRAAHTPGGATRIKKAIRASVR